MQIMVVIFNIMMNYDYWFTFSLTFVLNAFTFPVLILLPQYVSYSNFIIIYLFSNQDILLYLYDIICCLKKTFE